MKLATNTFQQGDVIGKKLISMPAGERKKIAVKRLVVAHGESGHSHVIEDDEAELIEIGGKMLLTLTKPAIIKHEEHKHIELDKGIWEIGRVQEYDWYKNMSRPVVD